MKTLLIIGGTGVLSYSVATEAIRQNISVTLINRGRHRALPEGATLIKSDKDDLVYIAEQLQGRCFDAVMDFLCFTDPQVTKSFRFYSKYTKQYFFISSCAVYNTKKNSVCYEDSEKILDEWNYSVNKWAGEVHLKQMAEEVGVNYTVIRPAITYDDTRIPYGIAPRYGYHWTIVERIKHGKPIIRWNNGTNKSNMMRVEDFAIGVVGLIGNPMAMNEAFNVCGDETPTYNDVIEIVENWLGKKAIFVDVTSEFYAQQVPSRKGEIMGGRSINSINSNEKLKKAVPNFSQNISIKEGVVTTLNAYKNNNYQRGIEWEFDGECDRVVKNWCKANKISLDTYRIGFIDYLLDASFSDKYYYWKEANRDSVIAKFCDFVDLFLIKFKIKKH